MPNEPITVVLSKNGWVRAAKGHDVDGKELSYKAGDEFKAQTLARTNQQVLFLMERERSIRFQDMYCHRHVVKASL